MTLTSTDEKPRNRPKAIYNSRVPNNYNPSPTVRIACRLLLVFCLLCGSSTRLWSLGWEVPEQQLADKIAAATGPGAVSLEVVNRSSISRNDSEEITRALQ